MKAAAAVMKRAEAVHGRAEAAGLGRVLAGRDGTFSRLPPPFQGWSDSRDTPAPPPQSFRSWFASAEGAAAMRAAAEEGARHTDDDPQEAQ